MSRSPGNRRLVVGVARWALGCAIVGFLLLRFDFGAVARTLQQVEVGVAGPAILGLVAVHLVGAAAWRDLSIRLAGLTLPWRPTITHYYAAQAVGSLTPANLGADAYRLAAVREPAGGWATLLLPIVVQRVTSYVALTVVALAGLVLLPSDQSMRLIILSGLGLAGVSAAVVLLIRRPRLTTRFLRLLPERMRPQPRGAPASARAWAASLLSGVSFGLAFHLGSIALVYALVAALGGSGEAAPILAAIAVARLSILIPLSPSGLGFQEAALSVLFLQIGLSAEMALATALLNRVALLGTIALGSAFIVSRRTGTLSRGCDGTPRAYRGIAD